MSYLIGVPERSMSGIAVTMYDDYCMNGTYNPLHYMPCLRMACGECHTDRGIYRVCPGCGDELTYTYSKIYECSCGTIMHTCLDDNGLPIVTKYATPNPLFVIKEDTI